jgi:hypothetical protein
MEYVVHTAWHRYICIETHREAYRITLFLGLNAPKESRVRFPMLLQYTQHEPTAQLIQMQMDNLSTNTHLQKGLISV